MTAYTWEQLAVEVMGFPGSGTVSESDLADPLSALEQALAIRVTDVRLVDAQAHPR